MSLTLHHITQCIVPKYSVITISKANMVNFHFKQVMRMAILVVSILLNKLGSYRNLNIWIQVEDFTDTDIKLYSKTSNFIVRRHQTL